MLRFCTKQLFPGIVEYFAFVASLSDDPPRQALHLNGVGEIAKAFSSFFGSLQDDMSACLSSSYPLRNADVKFLFRASSIGLFTSNHDFAA
jgi:hypothetical protein